MSLSFPVSFLLGSALADSVGVKNQADRIASGVTCAVTGGSPVGIVLARQIAINRASTQVVPVPTKDGRMSSIPFAPKESEMDEVDKAIQRWIDTYQPTGGEKLTREEIRAHLLAALDAISARLRMMPLEEGLDPAGTDALKSMLAAIIAASQPPATATQAEAATATGKR